MKITVVLTLSLFFGSAFALEIGFHAEPTSGIAPCTTTFVNDHPGSYNLYSYTWLFGDGSKEISEIYKTNHIYNTPGIYTVSLIRKKSNLIGKVIQTDTLTYNDYITITSKEPTQINGITPVGPDWFTIGQNDVDKLLWGGYGFLAGWFSLITAGTMWASPSKSQLGNTTGDDLYWASHQYREGAKQVRMESAIQGNLARVSLTLAVMAIDAATTRKYHPEEFTRKLPIYFIILIF